MIKMISYLIANLSNVFALVFLLIVLLGLHGINGTFNKFTVAMLRVLVPVIASCFLLNLADENHPNITEIVILFLLSIMIWGSGLYLYFTDIKPYKKSLR